MRETVGSLKFYFIVIAVIGLIADISAITEPQVDPLSLIGILIGLAFSAAYLYIGLKLRKLLAESPKLVSNVILADIAYLIIGFLLSLLSGFQFGLVILLAIGILIDLYLLSNVDRLSLEEQYRARSK